MLMGAVAGFSATLSTGNPWIGLVAAMIAGGLMALLHAIVTISLRADQVVSGLALTFLGTGLARVLGEGLTNTDVARLPSAHDPAPLEHPDPRPDPLQGPERPRLRRLPVRAARLVLDRADPPGPPPARGRRGAGRGRRPGDRRVPAPLRLRRRRRRAGRPRRGDDHAGGLARLVRRPDRQRPRLDRDRARDLRPLGPDPGGPRRLPVRRDHAVHPRAPGRRHDPRRRRTRSCPAARRRSSSRCCRTCS